MIGEFGAFRFSHPTIEDATQAPLEWQSLSCQYGIDGWLLWTWVTEEQAELWHGSSGGGRIA